jgi:protein-disulfide isomerase
VDVAKIRFARSGVYAVLTAAALVAAYFTVAKLAAPKLEFRDIAFPEGFRALVLESGSSPVDPLFFGMRPNSPDRVAPKPNTHQVCDSLFQDLNSPAIGSPESQVQIATFLDYRCPYCKKLAGIMAEMSEDHVRVVYKEWPILGDNSVLAARYALAADRQGKYLAFHLRLMNSRLIPTVGYIEQVAAELGMSVPQLRDDMNSDITTRTIQRNAALASALGFIGTPAMVVARTIVQGEISRSQLERLIEDEKQPRSPKAC